MLDHRHVRAKAPFGRGRAAARVLAVVIDAAADVGGRLPAGVAHRLAVVGGTIEWAVRPRLRRRLAINLAHAVGGGPADSAVKRLVRAELVNEAKRSADLLWSISRPDELRATIQVDGHDHVERAARRGKGLLLAGIHLGGWEVAAGAPAVVVPVPTTVIVADDWLAWGIEHVRVALGLKILYRSQAALGGLRVVRRGEALLVLGDDAFGPAPRTHLVQFCGAAARLPSGVVTLARLAGAPIIPFDVLPIAPRRWRIRLGPIVEPPARDGGDEAEQRTLQQLADLWTESVRLHPEHWSARFPIAWEPP